MALAPLLVAGGAPGLEVMRPELGTRPRVYYRNLWRYTKCFIGGTLSAGGLSALVVDRLRGLKEVYRGEEHEELLANAASTVAGSPLDLRMVIDSAARLDLVQTFSVGDGTGIRFNHAISQAYLTSRFLHAVPDAWRTLVEQTASLEMRESLVMWSARAGDRQTAKMVCEALVQRARTLSDDRGLALVVTAAQGVRPVGRPEWTIGMVRCDTAARPLRNTLLTVKRPRRAR